MIKIAVIVQYLRFIEHLDAVRCLFPNTVIEIFEVQENNCATEIISIAKKIENKSFDAIICGGFNYEILSGKLNIPLVNIVPDFGDIFATWYNMRDKDQKYEKIIIFMFYKNHMLQDKNLQGYLEELFNTEVKIVLHKTIEEYDQQILTHGSNTTLVIGAAHAMKRCNELGIDCEFLGVSISTLKHGIENAIQVVTIRNSEILKNRQLQTVINSSNDGMLYLNSSKEIILYNQLAKKLLNISEEMSMGFQTIEDVIPGIDFDNIILSGVEELDSIVALSYGKKVIASVVPIINNNIIQGIVITLKVIEQLQEAEKKIRADLYKKGIVAKYQLDDIIGESQQINELKDFIRGSKQFDGNVLIYGETGTGKELFASSIHNESTRKNEPFYAINCAALSENLLQSELFGYSEGSFTGAKKGGKPGLFELAHGGTIYMDEIGEMPLSFQGLFLRVLQEKEIRRIGDEKIIPVDVRIIAATHKNLYQEFMNNNFRNDLYYRLNVINIKIPSLKERKEDIFPLITYFIQVLDNKYKKMKSFIFSNEAKKFILNYPWKGNVRELQNFVERIYMFEVCGDQISIERVQFLLSDYNEEKKTDFKQGVLNKINDDTVSLNSRLKNVTVEMILNELKKNGGNKTKTAQSLGVSRTYIWRKLKDL